MAKHTKPFCVFCLFLRVSLLILFTRRQNVKTFLIKRPFYFTGRSGPVPLAGDRPGSARVKLGSPARLSGRERAGPDSGY